MIPVEGVTKGTKATKGERREKGQTRGGARILNPEPGPVAAAAASMAAPRPRPWLHRAYAAAMDAALPAIRVYLWQRALTGVDRWDRVHERLGMPTVHRRPQGVVFWFHGASIGELMRHRLLTS